MQIDSNATLEDALLGLEIPFDIRKTLALLTVRYVSFDDTVHQGQLVLNESLLEDAIVIFKKLLECQFPIHKVVPIAAYNWDDEASMQDNNTSAFNYRRIIGTDLLSNHSTGRAIDINPLLNPYFARDGHIYPRGATYDPAAPGAITANGDIVRIFKEMGWEWLGDRKENKDYQHFQKLA